MELTSRSTRSCPTCRFLSAIRIERVSLSRSKATRLPSRFTMVSSRRCTRSKVVKRDPQAGQDRRLRMAAWSSDGRLSRTWVSKSPQWGHRISCQPCPAAPGRPLRLSPAAWIDWEAAAKGKRFRLYGLLSFPRLVRAALEPIQNRDYHLADRGEFRRSEPAGGARWRADADAGSDRGLFRVERHAVF